MSKIDESEKFFRKQVLAQFELEEAVMDQICSIYRSSVEKYHGKAAASTGAKASAVAKADRPKRKRSAYNVFVREQMKTDNIRALDHKAKMSAIATLWKGLPEDEKTPYTEMAARENAGAADAADAVDEQ